ncbi:MAG: cytochrome bc complex cytochrome b subunit [Omnitrophica bacterium RIFCSPLOWO2_12_FULL_44_17]|uniref:Cytochrome bc complex cytochrome b subunit n=1 Tax=Candidatus Danuiimicrobium aquiferis TaxID=1801832 RepID=A0A1G1L2D1_9BACT|nr:MAG: cytochrome bc complex cytochrome b subunit [Omnitrophica bacterium RIFCSPHIGHO2_02_FULL_45_28]OGW90030.1 MAG: cytochrome bc complex cytochrome b subunit [Omnitrophica bacterium RIFCSPHIGHO2_12_FULL_44_12]OGW99322.1 MAG: cytochrome bc complex cytochrome b subunit [Omnitrophica bacterium RIFCSPLOWO2_12_FULL_44_17]OGX02477.1 MAG: cytochrome bc complex cytochrome b subunit [Omnitrophica bacterium RIFCSPLOWO2_02_FULL_44_11]
MTGSNVLQKLYQWCEERIKWQGLLEFMKNKKVPVHNHSVWYYGGNILITFFLIQVVTGIALLFYYQPTPETAYESVRAIILETRFGWLIRSLHSWSASLMVATAFVHLFSTFFLKAYRNPRELTWMSGMLMFFAILGFGFSGYLLPWNELSYFATKVGTGIAGQTPFVGTYLKFFLRGGEEVGAATLSRFFAFHVCVLPMGLAALLAIHLILIQVHGLSVPVSLEEKKDKLKSVAFFPDFVLRECAVSCLMIAVVVSLSVLFPWELGKKADPFLATPSGIQPEWYFLFMFQALQMIPAKLGFLEGEKVGILFFILGFAFMLFVPAIDRQAEKGKKSPLFTWLGVLIGMFVVGMTLMSMIANR